MNIYKECHNNSQDEKRQAKVQKNQNTEQCKVIVLGSRPVVSDTNVSYVYVGLDQQGPVVFLGAYLTTFCVWAYLAVVDQDLFKS